MLQEIAERLNRNLRPNDLIGRYGGEEFAIILPRTDSETAFQVAERLRLSVAGHAIHTAAGALPLTISVGVSCLSNDMQTLDKLLQSADTALYRAKHDGRNRCVVYR